MNSYPINLDLAQKEVLIVGGGRVAYRKLKRLLKTDAKINLVSPKLKQKIKELYKEEKFQYQERKFLDSDIKDKFLVIAATDDKQINQQVAELAQGENILVNVVDNPKASNFTLPGLVKRGDLLLTVATSGNSPALAKEIRKSLERDFGDEFALFLELMAKIRPVVLAEIKEQRFRREIFCDLADLWLLDLLACNQDLAIDYIEDILPQEIKEQLDLDCHRGGLK